MNHSKRINSIDIFRLYCSILVVAIHINPFSDINSNLGYFVSQILSRIAVPFFFCVSGYYYIKKLNSNIFCTKQMFIKVFKIYLVWTIIYYTRDIFIYYGDLNIVQIIRTFVINFFINGSSYHFWYLIGLLFSILFVGLLYKLHLQKYIPALALGLYLVGLLGCSYSFLGNKIPLIKIIINSPKFLLIRRILLMGFPFFCLGGYIDKIYSLTKKHAKLNLIISTFLFIAEIIVVNRFKLGTNIIITIFLPVLLSSIYVLLLNNPLPQSDLFALRCHSLANYIYYSHPLLIWGISLVLLIDANSTCAFFVVLFLCYVSWRVLFNTNNLFIKKYII